MSKIFSRLTEDAHWEVEAFLAWHDDDARAAITTLLEDVKHLRLQLVLAEGAMSTGMIKGWKRRFDRLR